MAELPLLGEVNEAVIYPVKGMQGLSLSEVSAGSITIAGDRRYAFIDRDSQDAPNLVDTIKHPGLLKYKPQFYDPTKPKTSEVYVTTPDGTELGIKDPALVERISDESGKKLAVLNMGRGAYHSMPVSLMTLGTLQITSEQVGYPVDRRNFRQNFYIQTLLNIPYEEDNLIGKVLVFGGDHRTIIAVIKPDVRCATVNMNPESGDVTKGILRAIVKNHNNTLGVYCTILKEGVIRQGDPVYVATILGEN